MFGINSKVDIEIAGNHTAHTLGMPRLLIRKTDALRHRGKAPDRAAQNSHHICRSLRSQQCILDVVADFQQLFLCLSSTAFTKYLGELLV